MLEPGLTVSIGKRETKFIKLEAEAQGKYPGHCSCQTPNRQVPAIGVYLSIESTSYTTMSAMQEHVIPKSLGEAQLDDLAPCSV